MKRHVQARVDEELIDWFEENCGGMSKQKFIEGCFYYLRLAVEIGRLPPPDVYLTEPVSKIIKEVSR